MRCGACQSEITDPGRFCPECAAPLAPEDTPTRTGATPQKPSSSARRSSEDGHFPSGSLLGDRYRVVSLIGRGGMGEVYRASDLTLNQPVALKFLPPGTSGRPDLLERFHGEVRLARQVSHPNVCRVYDVGQVNGSTFISMEYVDGEDLGSLLRRIGRLPADKAVEIARKLCAGLAAAHAKGVLHRDLKPANIMIDGRGQALIMDFGLAAVADQVAGLEVLNGTPAYMAPEQLSGKEVTERSDIYALGLVLYEIFTGQRAFEDTDRSVIPSATSAFRDVDPVIDSVIGRCLDADPAKRPQTALALARMLPGGDPMAEALAAGQTPTPAMVAASEDTGALSVRGAVGCIAVVIVGLIALLAMSAQSSFLRRTPFPFSHEVLAQKARELAGRLGYSDRPVDSTSGFYYRIDYLGWAQPSLKAEEFRELIRRGQPSPIYFVYRQSPQYLEPRDPVGRPTDNDPPLNLPGALRVELDPEGRLTRFLAVPPQQDSGEASSPAVDWGRTFEAAGLDRSRWTETASQEIPPFGFDERRAWTGTFAHAPGVPLRIEAAAWKGRPVSFELFGPWRQSVRVQTLTASQAREAWIVNSLIGLILLGASWMSWRNYGAGRGDVTGAVRLAAFGFAAQALGGIIAIHHVPTPAEASHVLNAIGFGLFMAASVAVLYLALEPFVRRRWPQCLISWSRLLKGDLRDPLVAGHLLLGTAFGVAAGVLQHGVFWYEWRSEGALTLAPALTMLDGVLMTQELLTGWILSTALTLGVFFFFTLLRLSLRSSWAATAGLLAVIVAIHVAVGTSTVSIVGNFVHGLSLVWVMLRFGILTATIHSLVTSLMIMVPMTSDPSEWYAGRGLIIVALTLALAVWSLRHALAGRRVLRDGLLDG